jgi:DNA polymerase III sliding clamp (beta) subunit (PCNA family)
MGKPRRNFKLTVPRAALELHKFKSGDDNRHNLAYIQFKPRGSTIDSVVTDGHRLAKFTWVVNEKEDYPKGAFCLLAATVEEFLSACTTVETDKMKEAKKAKKTYKRLKKEEFVFTLSCTKKGYRLNSNNGVEAQFEPEAIEFPQWEQLIPRYDRGLKRLYPKRVIKDGKKDGVEGHVDVQLHFGVNLQYLLDFGKYLWSISGFHGVTMFPSEDGLGPIVLEPAQQPEEGEALYLVMPMRT